MARKVGQMMRAAVCWRIQVRASPGFYSKSETGFGYRRLVFRVFNIFGLALRMHSQTWTYRRCFC